MARSERDLGMLDQAREHLTTALELREKARSRIASPEIAASYFSQSRFIFDVYIDVLMRQGHEAEAFEASERSTRARTDFKSRRYDFEGSRGSRPSVD